jgi:predicted nucleic acid-binding protein
MILDTNALSAAADNDPGMLLVLSRADEVALPVIVLGEYRFGISQSRKQAGYESWLRGLMADCSVLGIDEETTHWYAQINLELRRIGKPIPTNDLWIAALCQQHSLPIVSRDRHFDHVPGTRRIEW